MSGYSHKLMTLLQRVLDAIVAFKVRCPQGGPRGPLDPGPALERAVEIRPAGRGERPWQSSAGYPERGGVVRTP